MRKAREAFPLGAAQLVTGTAAQGGGVGSDELSSGSLNSQGIRVLTKEKAGLGLKTRPLAGGCAPPQRRRRGGARSQPIRTDAAT